MDLRFENEYYRILKTAKYAVKAKNIFAYKKTIQEARNFALDILKKHNGYIVTIFKIEKIKEKKLGGVNVYLKEISEIKF